MCHLFPHIYISNHKSVIGNNRNLFANLLRPSTIQPIHDGSNSLCNETTQEVSLTSGESIAVEPCPSGRVQLKQPVAMGGMTYQTCKNTKTYALCIHIYIVYTFIYNDIHAYIEGLKYLHSVAVVRGWSWIQQYGIIQPLILMNHRRESTTSFHHGTILTLDMSTFLCMNLFA